MPQSFYLCKTASKVEDIDLSPTAQGTLKDENNIGLTEGSPITVTSKIEDIHIGKSLIRVFDVQHDLVVKQSGKVFEQNFSYYMNPHNFKMFYDKRKKMFFLQVNKKVAIDFLDILEETIPSFTYDPLQIDLKKIASKISNIKGAWLTTKRQGINMSAFYGEKVNSDSEVLKLIKAGKAKYINFMYPFEDNSYYTGIGKEGNIVIYADKLTEEKRLEILYKIYSDLF